MMQDVVEWGKLACKTRSRCRGNFPEAEQPSAEEWGEEAGEGTNERHGLVCSGAAPAAIRAFKCERLGRGNYIKDH
jgi:hypothetical protein